MEYPPQYQHNQHPHQQGGYQISPQSAGPGSLTSPSGPQSHMQPHNPNQASPILPSQTQSHYQPQSTGAVHPSMGYPQYAVGGGIPQSYGISPNQAAAMATAAAAGECLFAIRSIVNTNIWTRSNAPTRIIRKHASRPTDEQSTKTNESTPQ